MPSERRYVLFRPHIDEAGVGREVLVRAAVPR